MKSKKQSATDRILAQVLSQDYWEGFYSIDSRTVVRCQDRGGDTAVFIVYSLADGKVLRDGSVPYAEDAAFSVIDAALRSTYGRGVSTRISDEVSNPDRDEAIASILESREPLRLPLVRNLISYVSTRGISCFGGPVGGRDLYTGRYEGFYLLSDGKILYCFDKRCWDPSDVSFVADGVVAYSVLDPMSFNLRGVEFELLGYLRGDTFSVIMEKLSDTHGTSFKVLGLKADDMFDLLFKAAHGDAKSADLAAHRLKIRILV